MCAGNLGRWRLEEEAVFKPEIVGPNPTSPTIPLFLNALE